MPDTLELVPPAIVGEDAEKDDVSVPSLAYSEMAVKWPKLHALLGGTTAMRAAKQIYLPMGEKENPDLYALKIKMAYLYAGYKNTVNRVVGKPFSKPVIVRDEENMPDRLRRIVSDVDLTGQNLTQFLRNVMAAGVIYGVTHILVDFDNVSPDLNQSQENELGTRARFIHIQPTQLIGWWPDHGQPKEIRVKEFRKERKPGSKYREHLVEYIRVYREDSWELHRKSKDRHGKESWTRVKAGTHSFGRVPLVTYYVRRTGNLMGEPPFDDLAHVNIAHWQSNADQRNILRFARVPILGMFGFSKEEMAGGLTVGTAKAVRSENTQADVRWAEHSGKAIDAGATDLRALRDQMEALGDQPLKERSGDITATGRAIDEARVHTDIHAWVRALENTAENAFALAAEWTKETLPGDFSVDVFDNFNLLLRSESDMNVLDRARQRVDLTRLTWLKEAKRRGVLDEHVDPEVEDKAAEKESATIGQFPAEDNPNLPPEQLGGELA